MKKLLVIGFAALLAGCSNLSTVDEQGHTDNPVWPDVKNVTFNHDGSQKGSHVTKESLELVQVGMNKDQMYNLIGRPHFKEGVRVREWDYVFNNAGTQCQFKILFDKNMNVGSTLWNPTNCVK